MALQPIDLQTLFMQMDRVGKEQGAMKEGVQIQQALQDVQAQQRTEQRIKSVNESQNAGDGPEAVKDRHGSSPRKGPGGGGKQKQDELAQKNGALSASLSAVIRDPALGKLIDISG
jgi:hypothetical protein